MSPHVDCICNYLLVKREPVISPNNIAVTSRESVVSTSLRQPEMIPPAEIGQAILQTA
jgi:hypothetical protein